jgi:hypothetical protein
MSEPVDTTAERLAEAARKAQELEETWLGINTRGRPVIDLEISQRGYKGEPIAFQGVLTRINTRGIFINTRRFGMRRFESSIGCEVGHSRDGYGLKIRDLSQLKFQEATTP